MAEAEVTARCCAAYTTSKFDCVDPVIDFFRNYCLSDEFIAFLQSTGIVSPSFTPNKWYSLRDDEEWAAMTKFKAGFLDLSASNKKLGIVFHGTPVAYIPSILRLGLDPSKRKRQAHGPGEYFSKGLTEPLCFCKNGKELLVFVVILPAKRKARGCPEDIVVVENNHHQLPLGTITYADVNRRQLQRFRKGRRGFQFTNIPSCQRTMLPKPGTLLHAIERNKLLRSIAEGTLTPQKLRKTARPALCDSSTVSSSPGGPKGPLPLNPSDPVILYVPREKLIALLNSTTPARTDDPVKIKGGTAAEPKTLNVSSADKFDQLLSKNKQAMPHLLAPTTLYVPRDKLVLLRQNMW